MKRTLLLILGLVGAAVLAAAQTPDSLDRNRSKYATYSFSKDDQYTVEVPYATVDVNQPRGKKVKNVIFMIGDGMGFEQVNVGWVANGGHLNMTDCMPVLGASRTYCLDQLITDSCAGGTALAIGQKTKYGYIGIDGDANPVESNLQYAKSKGMKTGVTVTCRINDATPAISASTALPARTRKAWLPSMSPPTLTSSPAAAPISGTSAATAATLSRK